VIDARHRHEFARGHIPGATWLGWEEWCAPPPPGAARTLAEPGYWGGLDRLEQLAGRLADAGIRDDRLLLVHADGPHAKGREGRIARMLLYLGAADVRLLDGGWSAWVAAGGPVSTEARAPVVGRFAPAVREHRRAHPHSSWTRVAGTSTRAGSTSTCREWATCRVPCSSPLPTSSSRMGSTRHPRPILSGCPNAQGGMWSWPPTARWGGRLRPHPRGPDGAQPRRPGGGGQGRPRRGHHGRLSSADGCDRCRSRQPDSHPYPRADRATPVRLL